MLNRIEDRHKLIIDNKVRNVIELIYSLALAGNSPRKIAEMLTLDKYPIPIVYKKDPRAKDVVENDGFGIWKRQTVYSILTNEMYIGNMVQNTHNKISYSSKKLRKTNVGERIIVPSTHEAIISKEIFEKVQEILNKRANSKVTDNQRNYLFGGLIYCHECGRTIRISKDVLKNGVRHYTQCNLYTRKGKFGICSSHRINYDWLEEDIINYLQGICKKCHEHYNFDVLNDNFQKVIVKNLDDINKKINRLEKMVTSYNETVDNLYVDKMHGLIDEDMYKRIYNKTKLEIKKVERKIEQLENQKSNNRKEQGNYLVTTKVQERMLNYMMLNSPTKDQIMRLISKIEIDKEKKVYVYLNFQELFIK